MGDPSIVYLLNSFLKQGNENVNYWQSNIALAVCSYEVQDQEKTQTQTIHWNWGNVATFFYF